jgi:hypothetical protein
MGTVGGGGGGSVTEFFGKFCDIYRPCCQAAGLRSDGQQCRVVYGALVPPTGFNAAAGETCLNATRAAASQPGFCEGSVPEVVECSRVFQSASGKAPGEACTEDVDCAPSAEGAVNCESDFSGAAEIRQCQVEIRGTPGSGPCIWTVDGNLRYSSGSGDGIVPRGYACYVIDGLRCDEVTDTCVALKPVGATCGASDECVKGAFCDETSKCAMRRAPGGACNGSDGQCAATAYCSEATLMCAARQATGTSCTDDAQCMSGSCVNSACEAGSGNNLALAFLCGQP